MGRKKRAARQKTDAKSRDDTRVEPGYIPPDFIEYYKNQFVPSVLSEEEFHSFIMTCRITLPHVFRLSTNSANYPTVREQLQKHITKLKELGFDGSILDFIDPKDGVICKLTVSRPELRKNEALHPFRDWLHAHTEVGDITRQEFVSMLPTLFLNVDPNCSVIDMCAAPGSKTMQILENFQVEDSHGFIIANDIEPNRCRTLVHQLNRIETSKVLVINHPAQFIPDLGLQFDRVLCDVPCSGDGTFRKNADASVKWRVSKGCGLHSIQRSILVRGLQLLKVGGVCVYSTCSLNPIEDEAVINSVLNELANSNKPDQTGLPVSIVDTSSMFPGLVRSKGVNFWNVFSDVNAKYDKYEDVPEDLRKQIKETMFPVNVVDGISHCMRFFPHQNDSGGFFVAVLRKNFEFDVKVEVTQNNSSKVWKLPPFIPLNQVTDGPETIQRIINDYGINTDKLHTNCLFSHAEESVKTIFYLSDQIADIVQRIPYKTLFPVACGTRMFCFKSLNDYMAVNAFPSIEGIDILYKAATKRIVTIAPSDLKTTLQLGNTGMQFSEMTEKAQEQLVPLPIGGLIVVCEGTNFVYGGMKRKTNLTLQVKKERIKPEIFKLVTLFPELEDDTLDTNGEINDDDTDHQE